MTYTLSESYVCARDVFNTSPDLSISPHVRRPSDARYDSGYCIPSRDTLTYIVSSQWRLPSAFVRDVRSVYHA
jgi:hypothetical protein